MDQINIATYIIDDDQGTLDIIKETIEAAGIKNYRLFINEEEFIDGLFEEIHCCIVNHKLTKLTGLDILKAVNISNERQKYAN